MGVESQSTPSHLRLSPLFSVSSVLKLFRGWEGKNLTQRTQRKEEGHGELGEEHLCVAGMKLVFTEKLAARILKDYVECER